MKVNMPVTGHEVDYEDDMLIVSRTDLHGNLVYANRDFIRISGFTEEELIGKPHHIVRHPDMPPAAFEDLWRTLKSGKPWSGMVKNRCKNGDHYWVEANVTPVFESGQIVGYLSVRTKPSRQRVEQAETLYARMREGRARGTVLRAGRVIEPSLVRRLNLLRLAHERVSLRSKFMLIGLLLLVPLLLALGLLGQGLMRDVAVTRMEQVGLQIHGQMRQLLPELQKHRGLAGLAATGNADAKNQLASIEKRIDSILRRVDEEVRLHPEVRAAERWREVGNEWTSLLSDMPSLDPAKSFARHTDVIEHALDMMRDLANNSGLVLDPDPASYHVMNAAVLNAMDLAEHMGRARGFGAQMITRGQVDTAGRTELLEVLVGATAHRESIEQSFGYAALADPSLSDRLAGEAAAMAAAVQNFSRLAHDKVLLPAKPEIAGPEFFAAGSQAVDAVYVFYDKSVGMLDGLLAARVRGYQVHAAWLIGGTLALFVLGVAVAWLFVRTTVRSLGEAVAR
ncbi:PAS domain-containing protein, partial [Uliginosibacterium paludis]